MIKLTIDNVEVQVAPGTSVLEAAIAAGIKIPHLCFHAELPAYGACRVCLIEIVSGDRSGLQASCTYKAIDGLVVLTASDRVLRTRKIILELLMARAPKSEKIRTMAAEHGIIESRIELAGAKDCILCGLCVRACDKVVGRQAIDFYSRGHKKKVATPFDQISETCIGCGTCAYVCPTKTIKIEEA